MARQQVMTARIIIEPGNESIERTRGYVVSALKNSFRNLRDGSAVIALYNEDDELIGMDISGTPSEELQEILEKGLGLSEEGPLSA